MRAFLLLGMMAAALGQDHLYFNILAKPTAGSIEASHQEGVSDIININLPDVCKQTCRVCLRSDNSELLSWKNQDFRLVAEADLRVATLIDCETVYGPERCSHENEAFTVRFDDSSVPPQDQRPGVVAVNAFIDAQCDCMDCEDFEAPDLNITSAVIGAYGVDITLGFNTDVFIDLWVDRDIGDEFDASEIIDPASIAMYLGTQGEWKARWDSRRSLKLWPSNLALSKVSTGNARGGFQLSTVPGALYINNYGPPHNTDAYAARPYNFRVHAPDHPVAPVTISFGIPAGLSICRNFSWTTQWVDLAFDGSVSLSFNVDPQYVVVGKNTISLHGLPYWGPYMDAYVVVTASNWIGSWTFTENVTKPYSPPRLGNQDSCLTCIFSLNSRCQTCYGNQTGSNCDSCLSTFDASDFPSCTKCATNRQGPKCETCTGYWSGSDCLTCDSPYIQKDGNCIQPSCPVGQLGSPCTPVACPAVGYQGTAGNCTCLIGYKPCGWLSNVGWQNGTALACPATGYKGTSPNCACAVGYKSCGWSAIFATWTPAQPVACPQNYTGTTPNCACAPGFEGCAWNDDAHTWTMPTLIDTCAGSPCRNGGTCGNNAGLSFTCSCSADYQGLVCDVLKVVRPDLVPDGKAIITGRIEIGVPNCTVDEQAFARVLSKFVPGTTEADVKVSNYTVTNCDANGNATANPPRRLLASNHVANINYYVIVNQSDAAAARNALTALANNATALNQLNDAFKAEGVADQDADAPVVSPVTSYTPPPTDCELGNCTGCNCETGFETCEIATPAKNGGEPCPNKPCACATAKKKKLSGGAIAGIVIGSVVFVFFVVIIAWYICCKKSKKEEPATSAEQETLAGSDKPAGAQEPDGGVTEEV